ncbi:hypothetical protein [Acinetobacter lanii]|uniref:Uncharacterized protein n=1 Tax=Acinetobacter lanii TaxID=2715163 RepID=A0A6G8S4I5_9GAMM|nr:hypothetical protein [Acinetobacter lanii]QIO09000.1 hypothetical protein G8D99_08245 [Acinetobacter lanii]
MARKLEELLMQRSTESQNRILKNAKKILKDCLSEDEWLLQQAVQAKSEKKIKLTLDELRARIQKNST